MEGVIREISFNEGTGTISRTGAPPVPFNEDDLDASLVWSRKLVGRRVRFEIEGGIAVKIEPCESPSACGVPFVDFSKFWRGGKDGER